MIFKYILWPFQFFFYFIHIYGIIYHIQNLSLISTTTEKGFTQMLLAWIISKMKGCLFRLDVCAFNWISIYKYFVLFFAHRAHKVTVSTKSMKLMLLQHNIISEIILFNPGSQFIPYPNMKKSVCEMLGINNYQEIILVAVPLHYISADNYSKFEQYAKSMLFSHIFILFADSKAIKQFSLESTPKNIFIMNSYIDSYPQILGSCDVGISFDAAPNILDIAPEIYQMKASGLPIICIRHGCASEIIQNGKNGYIVDSSDDLFLYLQKIEDLKNLHLKSINDVLSNQVLTSTI